VIGLVSSRGFFLECIFFTALFALALTGGLAQNVSAQKCRLAPVAAPARSGFLQGDVDRLGSVAPPRGFGKPDSFLAVTE